MTTFDAIVVDPHTLELRRAQIAQVPRVKLTEAQYQRLLAKFGGTKPDEPEPAR